MSGQEVKLKKLRLHANPALPLVEVVAAHLEECATLPMPHRVEAMARTSTKAPPSRSAAAESSSSKKRKASPSTPPDDGADERPSKDRKPEDRVPEEQNVEESTPDKNTSGKEHQDDQTPEDEKPEDHTANTAVPPLPDEPTPPPLPDEEPPPAQAATDDEDGWEPVWDDTHQAFYFFNRFTQATQWENPRVPSAEDATQPTNHDRIAPAASDTNDVHPAVAGGYNPAIHGSYDPNAPYAQYAAADPSADADATAAAAGDPDGYVAAAQFNRFTGRFQHAGLQPGNFSDESKARRQMGAFFDVDAAANSHNGRSLKAERAGKRLTKEEVKQFRERRKERKEEKKRAWLRD